MTYIPRLSTRSEQDEQIAVMTWARYNEGRHPELRWLFHIPNGGTRHPAEAVTLKRMGVKSGVPDLCLPYPSNGYTGLWVEMKTDKGRPTASQKEWIAALESNGYKAIVCHGAQDAINEIEKYLKGE